MPTGLQCDTEIIGAGLGLSCNPTNGAERTKVLRLRQIDLAKQGVPGYRNLTVLIPNKKDRIFEVHPLSPSAKELALLSKRQFDQRVKNWKKALHEWDNIETADQIPRRLWSRSMIYQHHAQTIAATQRQREPRERRRWTPKKKEQDAEVSRGQREEESVYSPTKNRWYVKITAK